MQCPHVLILLYFLPVPPLLGGLIHTECRILVPDQESNLYSLHWKLGVLTTGPLAREVLQSFFFYVLKYMSFFLSLSLSLSFFFFFGIIFYKNLIFLVSMLKLDFCQLLKCQG